MPTFNAVTDKVLLAAVRAQVEAQVAGSQVPAQMGDRAATDGRHKLVEIVAFEQEREGPEYPGLALMKAARTVTLRWWMSVAQTDNTDDDDPADFAESIVAALVGTHNWSHTYQTRFDGRRPAIERVGGWYRGEISITSHRASPQGSP